MPSAGRGLSNNRLNEDLKNELSFQVVSGDWRLSKHFYFTCWLNAWESGSDGGVCGFGEPRPFCISQKKKRKKKLKLRREYSSTQRAALLRSHLSCGIKEQPSAATPQIKKAVHSHQEPAVYFCFPSGHWANISGKVVVMQSVDCDTMTGIYY